MTKKPRIAVVVGTAGCVFEDLALLNNLIPNREDYTVYTVNFATMLPIKPNYICAIHGDYIDTYKAIACIKAEEYGWRKDFYTISTFGHADYIYDDLGVSGTSGRFTASVALEMGYDKVIFVGVPLSGSKRFYGDIRHDYSECLPQVEWQEMDGDKVKSFSGNTRKLLGEPTESWLKGGEDE